MKVVLIRPLIIPFLMGKKGDSTKFRLSNNWNEDGL